MKSSRTRSSGGFTLMETVIAIGVLAILLTSFMAVFGPASAQLRKAISVQEADRLVASLDHEMTTVRPGTTSDYSTGFDKGYQWLRDANKTTKAILLYQYRGNPAKLRSDGSMDPYTQQGGTAGRDFVVQPMVRQRDDQLLSKDIEALDGPIYTVQMTQLVFNGGQMKESDSKDEIKPMDPSSNSNSGASGSGSDGYPDATLAFEAKFFIVPNSSIEYIRPGGKFDPTKLAKPIFTNNMAIRR